MRRRELTPVILGLGMGAALRAAPGLFSGAFGINPRDGLTYVVAVLLLGVAVLATYIPFAARPRRARRTPSKRRLTPRPVATRMAWSRFSRATW